ncbi:hypothetical protein ACJIZ3_016976 [Penstemon smallii]|uniref:Uncharacterized protein n=1 Tax=Penstemon smallii TaxID=265156 RepID=A0ABD3SUA8_9LAMI
MSLEDLLEACNKIGSSIYPWSPKKQITKIGSYLRNAWHKEVGRVNIVLEMVEVVNCNSKVVVEMYNNMVEEEREMVEVVVVRCRSTLVVAVRCRSTLVVAVSCRSTLVVVVSCRSTLVVVVTCSNT